MTLVDIPTEIILLLSACTLTYLLIEAVKILLSVYFSDKDECSENNGGCSYQCTNLVGGFQCSCRAGYALSDDQLTCTGMFTHT